MDVFFVHLIFGGGAAPVAPLSSANIIPHDTCNTHTYTYTHTYTHTHTYPKLQGTSDATFGNATT
jgi:hypothetical protein